MSFQGNDTVECINDKISADNCLKQGHHYTVLMTNIQDSGMELIKINCKNPNFWWDAKRFRLVASDAVVNEKIKLAVSKSKLDMEEERLRSILTTPSHAHDCRKCGAPKPCSFHP